MYIIVKYGKNESLLCNPSCAVINLLTSIKRRAGYGNTGVILDLSDETGLVKDLDIHKNEYATKFLVSHTTYILVQKEQVVDNELHPEETTPTPVFQYVPLLEEYSQLFPDYKVHVQEVEKKKPKRGGSKSPSPAGRLRKGQGTKRTSRKR